MAKRKRLDPARLIGGTGDAAPALHSGQQTGPESGPESGQPAALPRRAPIADVAGDAASRAAFEEVAGTLAAARAEGRMIQRIALDDIDPAYLVRDRIAAADDEMAALCASLAARGQQTAIEVADLGPGAQPRWGLISGWRRISALARLRDAAPTPQAAAGYGTVLAVARAPRDAGEAYLAMVEENEIRVGLSFYERGRIVARAVDKSVYPDDRAALGALFASASRAKRSKIGSFVRIVRALDGALRYPTALTERSGLALAGALDRDPGLEQRLISVLQQADPKGAEAEAVAIAAAIAGVALRKSKAAAATPIPGPGAGPVSAPPTGRVTVEPQADGRLILSGPLAADPGFRARLEAWIAAQE